MNGGSLGECQSNIWSREADLRKTGLGGKWVSYYLEGSGEQEHLLVKKKKSVR